MSSVNAQATEFHTIIGKIRRMCLSLYWRTLLGIVYCTGSQTRVVSLKYLGCISGWPPTRWQRN